MSTVAKVRYTGNSRTHTRSTPAGNLHTFQSMPSGDDWVDIESTEDAEYLEGLSVFEVDWTPSGKAKDAAENAADAAAGILDRVAEWGYDRKQSAVKELRERGVIDEDFALNQSGDDLEAELTEHAEKLAEAMED